jgi:hypothetical protein
MESVPTAVKLVVHAEVREAVSATAERPVIVVPFKLKATVPVGVGGPEGVTVAVKVTVAPRFDGLTLGKL